MVTLPGPFNYLAFISWPYQPFQWVERKNCDHISFPPLLLLWAGSRPSCEKMCEFKWHVPWLSRSLTSSRMNLSPPGFWLFSWEYVDQMTITESRKSAAVKQYETKIKICHHWLLRFRYHSLFWQSWMCKTHHKKHEYLLELFGIYNYF